MRIFSVCKFFFGIFLQSIFALFLSYGLYNFAIDFYLDLLYLICSNSFYLPVYMSIPMFIFWIIEYIFIVFIFRFVTFLSLIFLRFCFEFVKNHFKIEGKGCHFCQKMILWKGSQEGWAWVRRFCCFGFNCLIYIFFLVKENALFYEKTPMKIFGFFYWFSYIFKPFLLEQHSFCHFLHNWSCWSLDASQCHKLLGDYVYFCFFGSNGSLSLK